MSNENIPKFYSAKTDRVFKTVISKYPHIIEGIISQALDMKVEFISFISPELNIFNVKERVKTVDCLINAKDKIINVELNTSYNKATMIRNYNYFSSFYVQQTNRGETYNSDLDYIQINLSYGMPKKMNYIKKIYRIQSDKEEVMISNVYFLEINMDKLMKLCYDGFIEGKDYSYLYMLDLKDKNTLEEFRRKKMNDKIVNDFTSEVVSLNKNQEFVYELSAEEENEKMQKTLIEIANKEGIELGMERGTKLGMERGTEKRNIEVAKNLINLKVPMDIIIKATGLSKKVINTLF